MTSQARVTASATGAGPTVAYQPASRLGWLDHDEDAANEVRALLNALSDPATLDPLGLGQVRDAFADLLAPGVSTVQTRLRYFVLVPWCFALVERQAPNPTDRLAALRDVETRLIEGLRGAGANLGIIGYQSGAELQRTASVVYWNGLATWGIRRWPDLSIAQHLELAGGPRSHRFVDDDGNAVGASADPWVRLPVPPAFPDGPLDIALGPGEATYLIDRVSASQPQSLLAHLMREPVATSQATTVWDAASLLDLPPGLVSLVEHARCASEVTDGPQLLYNLELARAAKQRFGRDTDALIDRLERDLRAWSARMKSEARRLRPWANDLRQFWQTVGASGVIRPSVRAMIEASVALATEQPDKVDSPDTRRWVAQQEEAVKGARAKLRNAAALEGWNGQPLGAALDYRWRVTRRYLEDLAAAP